MSAPPLPTPPPARRRIWLRALIVAAAVLAIMIGAAIWYASTPQFQELVREKLVATLEQATGGRTELQNFRWSLRHLAFEADGLTIHGLEAANEAPYAHIDRIYVRIKILSLLGRKKIDLNYFEADRPAIHLIIYPDGSTNQPRPKTEIQGKPLKDTLFDLQIGRTEVNNGVVLINQQAIPFNLAANDLGVIVTYSPVNDHYQANVYVADITAQRGKQSPVHSVLEFSAVIKRNSLDVPQFKLQTGPSLLNVTASLKDFTNPHWTLTAQGKVDVREVMALAPVEGVDRGLANLNLKGEGTRSQFSLTGQAQVTDAAYHSGSVHISGVAVDTALRATEDELALSGIRARLTRGGTVSADLRIAHWLGTAPAKNGQTIAAVRQGAIRSKMSGISLRTVMAMVAPPHYQDLGFDAFIAGDGFVDWTGNASDLSARANVSLTPPTQSSAGEVPLSGMVDATYFQKNGSVQIRQLQAHTPASQFDVSGGLGVYPISRPSTLQVNLETTNLGEFDRTLSAFGVASGGKHGAQVLPVRLQGQAQFHGTVSGTLNNPDVKGHLIANNFDVLVPQVVPANAQAQPSPPERAIHWDSLTTDAEYSAQLIAINQATLTRGKTAIHTTGQLHAHLVRPRQYVFDDESSIAADLRIQDARLDEILVLAGENLPVSGTVNLNAHAGGTLANLNGGGHISIQGGEVYGEPYRSLNADLQFAGDEIGASKLTFLQNGGQLTGDGGYRIRAKQFRFHAQGKGFDLAHFKSLQNSRIPITGQLEFVASGSGTAESPALQANAQLTHITIGTQLNGAVDLNAHTSNGNLIYTSTGHLATAQLQINGQTSLSGDYKTTAQAQLTNFDIDPFMEMFHIEGVRGHSSIAGAVNIQGPLRNPRQMQGDAQLNQFAVSLAGVPLKSEGPLHAQLREGILHLDPLHITGEDTDLHAQGEVGVLQPRHSMNVQAQGAINMRLIKTLAPDVTSSGQITFTMNAGGTFARPDLTGQVKLTNVAASVETFPNGLSQLNGTLEFTQDRLQVKSLTGTTGGGQVNVTGYITYQQGIYADLTATGKDIRIRYPAGISSMIDTKLRLQGTQSSMTLSGNVLLTRFTISPNLDFASFSGPSSASPPPDPNAFTNRVRLNVHITSSPELDFQNSYAKLAGDVDLRIRGTVAQPSVLGHITITEGSATFAGTKYQLQHGDIFFSNPVRIEPTIDLDATAHVEDYDITIGLHGTPSNLSPSFRSEPPLSQQDIFSLLAMGRTQEEQQIYSMQAQQAGVNTTADALLGGALNATLSSRIQRLFGGGSVKIDPSWVGSAGNSTARITVSQQVSKNATLTYATNINSTAQQLIQAEVNVTHTVSILAVRDESGVFSLLFKVHKRYR